MLSTLSDYRMRYFKTVLWNYTKPGVVVFSVSKVTAAPKEGAVYSDSTTNFTVLSASIDGIGEGTITATATAAPVAAPGTLTRASVIGDDTIAYSAVSPINLITLSLPPGTCKAVARSTGACTVKSDSESSPTVAPLTTWPQPIFSNPASGGDTFLWEPAMNAAPTLLWSFADDQTLELAVYVNTRIHPSTDITEAYEVVGT